MTKIPKMTKIKTIKKNNNKIQRYKKTKVKNLKSYMKTESTYTEISFYICRSEVCLQYYEKYVSGEIYHSHILGLFVMYSIH